MYLLITLLEEKSIIFKCQKNVFCTCDRV